MTLHDMALVITFHELERRRMLLLVISIYEYFYPILRRYLDQISVDERNSEKLK